MAFDIIGQNEFAANGAFESDTFDNSSWWRMNRTCVVIVVGAECEAHGDWNAQRIAQNQQLKVSNAIGCLPEVLLIRVDFQLRSRQTKRQWKAPNVVYFVVNLNLISPLSIV